MDAPPKASHEDSLVPKDVVVPIGKLLTAPQLGARCFLLGLLSFVVALFGAVFAAILVVTVFESLLAAAVFEAVSSTIAGVTIGLVVWISLPWSVWQDSPIQLTNPRRTGVGAICYGFGFAFLPTLIAWIEFFVRLPRARLNGVIWEGSLSLVQIALAYVAGQVIFGRMRRRYLILSGKLRCPMCEYDLRGNASMICPECGRLFTYEELEMTEAEFRNLQRLSISETAL